MVFQPARFVERAAEIVGCINPIEAGAVKNAVWPEIERTKISPHETRFREQLLSRFKYRIIHFEGPFQNHFIALCELLGSALWPGLQTVPPALTGALQKSGRPPVGSSGTVWRPCHNR